MIGRGGAGAAGWNGLHRVVPDLLTLALAAVVWLTFRPALLSPDSIDQYRQALSGAYNDWHPPLMAAMLHLTLRLHRGLGALMVVQCVAGAFGTRALAGEAMRLLRPRISPCRVAWLSLGVFALLLVPVSPLAFYLMTFWKDAWAAVALLWTGALLLRAWREGGRMGWLTAAALVAALLALTRHNAVAALPFVGLALAAAAPAGGARKLALATAPLALFLVSTLAIRRVLEVAPSHVGSEVMLLDLVGLCAADLPGCRALPWTAGQVLGQPALEGYRPGDASIPFWKAIRGPEAAMWSQRARVEAEYRRAWQRFPWRLARLKVAGFLALLNWDDTHYFFQPSIVANPYQLVPTPLPTLAPLREWLVRAASRTAEHRLVRWISGVHLVWLLANVLWIGGLLASFRHQDAQSRRFLAVVMALPLGYALSYLGAAPVRDFRFLYPSTLFVQTVTLASLLVLPWRAPRRQRLVRAVGRQAHGSPELGQAAAGRQWPA